MSALIKRAYSRNANEAPIVCANYDTENYYYAKMYNSGLGGMYFESERALQPGSDICIKMENHSSDESGPAAFKAYRARVKWCKKIDKSETSCYGIGIQYLAKSHTVYNFWQIYHHLGGGVQSLLGKRGLPLPAGTMKFFLFLVWF